MRFTNKPACCVLPFLLIVLPASIVKPAHAAVNPADLEALKQLFQKEPATAFEKSWKLFQKPRKEGDLDGMMEIIRVVFSMSQRCVYYAPVEEMIANAMTLARDRGKWEVAAELQTDRAKAAWVYAIWPGPRFPATVLRAMKLAKDAGEACAKAGKEPPQGLDTYMPATAPTDSVAKIVVSKLPSPLKELAESASVAMVNGDDPQAVADACRLLESVSSARQQLTDADLVNVLTFSCRFLHLPRGDQVNALLRQLMATLPEGSLTNEFCTHLAEFSELAWTGRHDAFLDQARFCVNYLELRPPRGNLYDCTVICTKMFRFGRVVEGTWWVEWFLGVVGRMPPDQQAGPLGYAFDFAHVPYTPIPVRAEVYRLVLRSNAVLNRDYWRSSIPMKGPESTEEKHWHRVLANLLAEAALYAKESPMQRDMIAESSKLFEGIGDKQAAEGTLSFLEALGNNDPVAVVQAAVIKGRGLVKSGQYAETEQVLHPVVTSELHKPTKALLEAVMLFEQVERQLGKVAEADRFLAKAKSFVNQVGLSSSDRLNYLITFADNATDQAEKTRLLEQARQAASEAGLTLMQESIANQLTDLALGTGNLTSAKQALLDRINQQEAKRERLAFDPLLRQQWFAGNLGSYRKLLQVCAQSNDASTALWCAEQMRARALRDQLAWQKVDMAVQLPPALRQRFDQLRKSRGETYALLREVTGMPVGEESLSAGDSRGMYMPIRGGVGDRGKASDEDVQRLKKMLDELTHEEGALEALIREAVPAYRMAAQPETLDAQALLQRIPPSCGVLQYTLTGEGLVMVGIGPGRRAVVKTINVKPEDLLKQVAEMRRRIVERSDKVDELGAWWYKLLVLPFGELIKGSRQVMIVADGALQLLPFAALQDADKHYLAEQYRLVYAPSIEVATLLRTQANTPQPPKSALVVAAPQLTKETEGEATATSAKDERGMYVPIRGAYMPIRGMYMPIRGEGGLSSAFESMASIPLPGAKAEGEKVAKRFPDASLLTGAEATKDRIAQEAGKYRVLHFATHGYADPEVPEFSGLLFAASAESRPASASKGEEREYDVLTAQQAYLWHLNADLVTLSACETGLGKDIQGEGLLGLTRAFLYAGAKDVVCSLWSVADESTAQLMEKFYDEWQKIPDAGKALQSAQKALMSQERTRHPFYWAAFVVVQGPR